MEVDVDLLEEFILEAEQPVRITKLAERAVEAWLERQGTQRRYTPGATYQAGEEVFFQGEMAIVIEVTQGQNPKQGQFQVLTLHLGNGHRKCIAAGIQGANSDDTISVSDDDVQQVLVEGGQTIRRMVEDALIRDPRFVPVPDEMGGHWYLTDHLDDVSNEEIVQVGKMLDEFLEGDDVPVPVPTEVLVEELWGLANDGSDSYRLTAFSLEANLQRFQEFEHFPGEGWLLSSVWNGFKEREGFESPRQPNVVPPATVEVDGVSGEETEEEKDAADESAQEPIPDDFISWQENRLRNAQFTLYARNYYHSWLPLSKAMRRVFPPKKSRITFYHRFGGEEESFQALLDPDQRRILGDEAMYNAFRDHAVYPGAKLVVSHRGNLNEYDIRTKPVEEGQTIQVRRLELLDDGTLEDSIETEPMRYEVDRYVVVGEVRWEDMPALFEQADRVGAGIFELMYNRCRQWQEERGEPLRVTADELYKAIHFVTEKGRPTTIASINWELWRRLAFKNHGNGKYLFRPEYGAKVRSGMSSSRRTQRREVTIGPTVTKDRSLQTFTSDEKGGPITDAQLAVAVANYRADSLRSKVLFLRSVAHQQIRELLAEERIDSLTLDEFNEQIWQIGTIRYEGREAWHGSADANEMLRNLTIEDLESAYAADKLEITGNQTWGSGAHMYGTRLSATVQGKEKILRRTLRFLLYGNGSLSARVQRVLDESNGLGMNVVTGVLHAMYPEEHILYNTQSVTAMQAMGQIWPQSWRYKADSYLRYRDFSLKQKRQYAFESLTDLDWFIYSLATGKLSYQGVSAGTDNSSPSYFIFQQHPASESEYADRIGRVYNWKTGIPGSKQIEEGARFVYYRPGEQVFFGTGRVAHISSYVTDDGVRFYNGHLTEYEQWAPPLPLTPELGRILSFVQPERRLGVGQAGIRKISKVDFDAILSMYQDWHTRAGNLLDQPSS